VQLLYIIGLLKEDLGNPLNIGSKLSNSGNTLELMIPNYNRKADGG